MEKIATNSNFPEILAAGGVVLVDFWATWCGPCRMLAPTVEDIAEEYAGKVTVVRAVHPSKRSLSNVDDCEDIAVQYGIRSIPTLIYFKDGQVVDKTVGLVQKADIVAKLNTLL